MNRRTRQAREATASRRPNYAAALELTADLTWAIEQVEEHGRHLGPFDLHEFAQETAGQILSVLRSETVEPVASAPLSLKDAVKALRTVLQLAEAGVPGAGQAATHLAEAAYALVHRYGTTAAVWELDGRAALPQRTHGTGGAHTLTAEAQR
jgi:hypothetical protein